MHWRADIQAVAFVPEGHGAFCVIHRLALRTLSGKPLSAQGCLDFAQANDAALRAAAAEKIARAGVPAGRSLHLTSRDVRRAMVERAARREGATP